VLEGLGFVFVLGIVLRCGEEKKNGFVLVAFACAIGELWAICVSLSADADAGADVDGTKREKLLK